MTICQCRKVVTRDNQVYIGPAWAFQKNFETGDIQFYEDAEGNSTQKIKAGNISYNQDFFNTAWFTRLCLFATVIGIISIGVVVAVIL